MFCCCVVFGGGGGGGGFFVSFCFVCLFLVFCCSLAATLLVPRENDALFDYVLCTPYNHAPVYSVTLFEATCGRLFSCNLPPALLAETPGSFTGYCGNGHRNKSQYRN